MPARTSLQLSRSVLASFGTRLFVHHENRIPQTGSVAVISNHRSFMDAAVLMAALNRPIHFACHHYMGQVPLMRDVVAGLGCFPLDTPNRRQQSFIRQGSDFLCDGRSVGVFPEGTQPMIARTDPRQVGKFQRGFAHLTLQFARKHPRQDVAVLPVAIVSLGEQIYEPIPIRLLHLFDPSEPLFDRPGWHPMVVYRHLAVAVGRPYWVSDRDRQDYQGKTASTTAKRLTETCHREIAELLQDNWQ